MNTKLLFNCMWYEEITPEMLAMELNLTQEQFYEKAFGEAGFTLEERLVIRGLLKLSDGEMERIFGEEA